MGICQRSRLSIDANKEGIIMSVKESIQYLTDQKSVPSYIVRKYGTGWLETMPDLKMYYLTGIPQEFYD